MSQTMMELPKAPAPPSENVPPVQPSAPQPMAAPTVAYVSPPAPPTYVVAPQPVYAAPIAPPGRGLSIAAMVCGIVGIVFAFIPYLGVFVAVVLGILAIAMGAIGRNRATQKGMGTTGLVLGVLSLVVAIGWWVIPLIATR